MENEKKIVKEDINFLEYPNWVIDRKNTKTVWSLEKPHGKYEVLSPLGMPKHFDKIVIYFLLYKLYREKNLEICTLVTNRYEIAKNIFGGSHFGKNTYNRIMMALKRWKAISINFEGLFYQDKAHTIRYFSVIDEVVLRKTTGELTIRFNEGYITQLKESTFYKLIDFEQYKKLHKTSSARLYEILVKSFKANPEWVINIQLLAEKITFEKREGAKAYYPSDVLRYLKPSIAEINKKTDLHIKFTYNKETGACIFNLLPNSKGNFAPAVREADENKSFDKKVSLCLSHFKTLSAEQQEIIIQSCKKQPFYEFLAHEEQIYKYMSENKLWPNVDN